MVTNLMQSTSMPLPLTWDSALVWDDPSPGIAWDAMASTPSTNRPMASDNRISLTVTAAQKTAIVNAVTSAIVNIETIDNLYFILFSLVSLLFTADSYDTAN
jgi:hypothetical protein